MASLVTIGLPNYPTPDEVRTSILRSMVLGAARIGLTLDVKPNSDAYIRADAYAKRVSIAIANGKIARDEFSPITATGQNLTDIALVFGVERRPAAGAAGFVTITATGTVTIPAEFQCTAPSGEKYQTTTAFTGTTGGQVQVQAVNGGTSTNITVVGTALTWDLATIGGLNPVCRVATGGITGGVSADGDDSLRRRLFNKLAFPGVGGNVSQVQQWAEEASASVDAAYVYAAVRGPGSYDIAITKADGDRSLSSAIVSRVSTYVAGLMPGHASLNVTTVTPQEVDVVLNITLSLPGSAGGIGGGWRDAVPWPNSGDPLVSITAYNSSTGVATTDASALNGLAVGAHIGVWDTDTDSENPSMREFVVDSVTLSGGFYDITVQGGFGFDPTDAYISAGAVNLVAYGETSLDAFRTLGPGEKTDSVDILPRGRRQPSPDVGADTSITSRIAATIHNVHSEIRSVEYAARYATGTTTTLTAPSVPTTTADAPKCLVLKHLAFVQA